MSNRIRILTALSVALLIALAFVYLKEGREAQAQAGRKTGENQKKNPNASGDPEEQKKKDEKQVDKTQPTAAVTISTDLVNVEAVVYNKKTGAVMQGLKKEHFEIYEDGVKQEIENFTTPDAPLTMVLLLEYSKLVDLLGSASTGYFEPGRVEVLRPAYEFVRTFVKPKDFISIIAYDIRPTPIVDFTDDASKLAAAVNLVIRNNPAFSESNLFDAMSFVLRGGKGDSVVLEDNKSATTEYAGLEEVNAIARDRLLACDFQHRLVDVAGIDLLRLARDELRPVARAAGDFEDGAPGEQIGDALAKPLQLVLALGLVVDLLVFARAPVVVRLELAARAARLRRASSGFGHGFSSGSRR